MPGDVFGSHKWEGGATGFWWLEVTDATKHSTVKSLTLPVTKLSSPKGQLCQDQETLLCCSGS